MEILELSEVMGVLPIEDIVEGRFVLLTTNPHVAAGDTHNFGGETDLPGAKLPDTSTEAKRARYILGWKQDDSPTPIYQTLPQYAWSLRQGFDQTANVPFSATVYLTQLSVQRGLTIPSGTPSLAFYGGRFTIFSGGYVYSAEVEVPGCPLHVMDTASDSAGTAGKLEYAAFDSDVTVAEVIKYYSDTGDLEVKLV